MAVRDRESDRRWQRTPPPTLFDDEAASAAAAEQTVARDRLVERLRPGPGSKLTLVAAPAGCGKTTLLGNWRELEEASRPVAWLSLDEGDNDPVVLWSYVLAALRGVCPTLDVSVVAGAGRPGADRRHRPARADQRADRARRCRARSRRLPPALERRLRATASRGSSTTLPSTFQLVARDAERARAAVWRRCGRTASCSSCARTSSASRPPRRMRS